MTFYNPQTIFTFGQYEGKTLLEVIATNPNYINWCQENLDHFYISDEVVAELKQVNINFHLTELALAKRITNLNTHNEYTDRQDIEYDREEDFSDLEREIIFEGNSDNMWNWD